MVRRTVLSADLADVVMVVAMTTITTFACDVCGTVYDTQAKAAACETQPVEPLVAIVGDIVTLKAGFQWFDGDPRWVSNYDRLRPRLTGGPDHTIAKHGYRCPDGDTNCFGACCTYQFYYVVTAIDTNTEGLVHRTHRHRYHVMTKAMTGKQGNRAGWTFTQHHYTPRVVERPPVDVIADSKDLLGQLVGHLL